MKDDRYDASDRALEKAISRDRDARAIASGEKSQAQMREENGAFAFPRVRVSIDFSRVKIKR
jgi:hypothetical protein